MRVVGHFEVGAEGGGRGGEAEEDGAGEGEGCGEGAAGVFDVVGGVD